jgi:hypothetical protein
MKGKRTKKWALGLGITGGVLVLLVVGGVVGWPMLMTSFVHRYYREAYAPIQLTSDDIGDYPVEHHLDDVPWLATEEAFCQGNSLQMIAAQRGIEEPRGYFHFLMGFTYGAVEMPGEMWLNPFTDPETGFVVAAPYLGLVRRYYVTDDEALYLDALRHCLSLGHPVRVGLDVAVFYDLADQLPHSNVLVGYDESGFYYYETVCMPGSPCEPGQLPPGEEGLWVPDQLLLEAVRAQAKMFSYPWRYSLTIFEEGPLEENLGPIWARNGQSLLGGAQYGPRQGADAIEALAAMIEERGVKVDVFEIGFGLEAAVDTRRDNAAYLREAWAGQADVERAADLFDGAADLYAEVLAALEDGIAEQPEADQIGSMLRDAAALEREVGQIFLTRGGTSEAATLASIASA